MIQPMKILLLGAFMLLIMMFLEFMFHLPLHTRISNIIVKQNIPSFPVLRRKLFYSMCKRVLTSSNSLVQALVDPNFFSDV